MDSRDDWFNTVAAGFRVSIGLLECILKLHGDGIQGGGIRGRGVIFQRTGAGKLDGTR